MSHARRRRLTASALLALTAMGVAACGGGTEPEPTSSPDASAAGGSGDAGAFPVTIQHALGETVIEAEPERVVTWGWGATDAVVALGVTPVAIPHQAYGGDAEGVLPWVREALEERGDEVPTVLPDTGEEVPYEEIVNAQPDVILAPYSGISQEQYETLAQIAPVVAYPDQPWATPWRDVVTTVGTALGKVDEAQGVLDDIDAQVADHRAAHPEFEGLTLAAVADMGGTFYVYADEDPRVEFMLDLGFESPEAVDELDTDESPFYFTLSHERLDELTSDVLVAYGATDAEVQAFLDAPYAQVMPQVAAGRVAPVVGEERVAAVSPPTALSLPWGLDHLVEQLAAAVAAG